jgi:hypothetical protein
VITPISDHSPHSLYLSLEAGQNDVQPSIEQANLQTPIEGYNPSSDQSPIFRAVFDPFNERVFILTPQLVVLPKEEYGGEWPITSMEKGRESSSIDYLIFIY